MKLKDYFTKSLSRQFVGVMGLFILAFIIGTAFIYFTQQHLNKEYIQERAELVKKEKVVEELDDAVNLVLFNVRGYLAFGNKELKTLALSAHPEIRRLNKELDRLATNDEDREYVKELRNFVDFYFIETAPEVFRYFEAGQQDKVLQISSSGATARVNAFQEDTHKYRQSIESQLEGKVAKLSREQSFLQIGFLFFLLAIILIFFQIIRLMLSQVGKPLAELAAAANDITIGKEVDISVDKNRKDEIGSLSVAFKKMITSLQEKEQDLLAQNEELIAQQDELQMQQSELEEVLETIRENEQKLERRNELINKVSNSLDKQVVLDSIVTNMSRIIEADKGLMIMLNEETYSAFGVSEKGVRQFKDNMESGLIERLIAFKKPYSIKREVDDLDKGFHTSICFCYDLYLPVLSSNNDVVAVMSFSRFGQSFLEKDMDEYEALAKQIGISLDKISMYEESEEDRRLNQDILNTVQEGIQLVDLTGTILQVNNQLSDMFHLPKEVNDLVGITQDKWVEIMLYFIEEKEEFREFVTKSISAEIKPENNSFIYKKKNENHVIKVYCEALYHGDERVGTILVHRDITKEYEVDQMKSEFVSTVSHELRTPLASILGFTELLLKRQLKPERQTKYLTTIYNEAKRLTALINDFLDVQRMEAGKQTYEKKYIELLPIIQKVIDSQQINTDQHALKIESYVESDYILGDKAKVEQVFTNLVHNAIKYSPLGGEIKIIMSEKDGDLKVDVVDEGLGIPEEALPKLFTRFYRVDNSDRRKIGGTGLGLSIVQEIMKMHDGEISVSSEFGKGSTFTVSFPLIEGKLEAIVTEKDSLNGRYTIMVVEDDTSLVQLISQELLDSGFQVNHYSNGKDALEALSMTVPDAIVLDILLGEDGIDGWRMMEWIKGNEELKNIPVIISSALDEKAKGFSLGATDYLVKPYKPMHLSKAIMQTLLNMGKVGQVLVPQGEK
ncbi:ATP-binding protein [Cytobacillus sp. FJAT-54145]|uniref:histidine kinase n=1 Tax=Cytobacillus spartinae TaxID=3299023 RepID=A0ABW6KFW2_9BACI